MQIISGLDSVGVSASVISNYAGSERMPSVEILILLAYLYHGFTDYLLGIDKYEYGETA